MYGAAKHVIVTAIFNSNKAKVMIKNIRKDSKTKRLKIIYTFKPKHFSEETISVESFENLLKRLADIIMVSLWLRILGWVTMLESILCL